MNFDKLAIFLSAVDRGSIRGAARALSLAQPSVSRVIRDLESTLGAPLVERSADGITLTRFGAAFAARARLLLADYDSALDEIRQLREGAAGPLRVGAGGAMYVSFLPEVMRRFRDANPRVELVLCESTLAPMLGRLREGALDLVLACTLEEEPGEEFELSRIGSTSMRIGVAGEHPLGRARSLEELKEAAWLLPAEDPDGLEPFSPRLRATLGIDPETRIMRFNSMLPALMLVRDLGLVCPFEGPVAEHEFGRFGLVAVPLVEPLPRWPVCIIQRRRAPLLPSTALFADCARRIAVRWFH